MRLVLVAVVITTPIFALSQVPYPNSTQNLQTCLSGKYPALCNHSLLTPSQAQQVRSAGGVQSIR